MPFAVALSLTLAACSASQPPGDSSLGRAIPATRALAPSSPAPVGDPPAERGGTIPRAAQAGEDRVAPSALAPTPQLALTRYAERYVNWAARDLPARERELAQDAVGDARLAAEQLAASASATAALQADNVADAGSVVAVAPGQGVDAGEWVVVTREQMSGSGVYAGLPVSLHVTLARVQRELGGWVVSAWSPAS